MKNIFTLLILALSLNGFSQTSGELVIFSNLGERFFVMVNGERQNHSAEGNVKVEGLLPGYYSCKVISENNLYALDKNFEVKAGMRLTMRIVEAKKSSYKLRYFSETLTSEAQQGNSGQAVVLYHPVGTTAPAATLPITTTTQSSTTSTTQSTRSQTPQSSTLNTGVNTGAESINININMSETGVSTSISGTGLEEEDFSHSTTISTTATTGIVVQENHSEQTHPTTINGNTQAVQNNFSSNCLVDNLGMKKVIEMIKNESFSESKMGVAKQFTKNRCLTVMQIKEIAQLFSFSEDMMEYVKYAYNFCLNTQDYYQLAEVFTFSDDKSTFNGFLNGK